jgi:dTDP-4-dehydrorhamnose reductase
MRILITGASGLLGPYLLREWGSARGVAAWSGSRQGEFFGVPLRTVDLGDPDGVARAFRQAQPDVVVHAAARARVADCFGDPQGAHRVNVGGTATLASLCVLTGARLVFVSTDLVFDGERAPYREEDAALPLSVYGKTKLEAEAAVRALPGGVVVRVSLLYGPSLLSGRPSFFDDQVAALRAGRPLTLFRDEWRTPLDLDTAAKALLAVARSDVTDVVHVGGPERLSRLEMGGRLTQFLGVDGADIAAVERAQAPAAEPRPRDVSLDSSHWRRLFPALPWPSWDEAMRQLPWRT